MNWIQENKFLSGLIGITVIGAAALIFLLMGARTRFAETTEKYDQQTAELQRLQGLKPYPEEASLKLLTDQREQHATEVQQLRNQLATLELARDPVSPEQFQDRLRSQVSEIEALAKENEVVLPDGFYLGFSEYQGTPPRGEATEMLAWELKSIVSIVRTVIRSKVATIDQIERVPLPAESSMARQPQGTRGQPGEKEEESAQKLVERYPFTIAFTADQSRFRSILNQITNTKEQFFIPRTLKIENEQTAGPAKVLEEAVAAPPPGSENLENLLQETAAMDGVKELAKTLSFIVGTEKVKVTLTIDIVDFAGPDQSGKTKAAAR